jgi:hypothetical protein
MCLHQADFETIEEQQRRLGTDLRDSAAADAAVRAGEKRRANKQLCRTVETPGVNSDKAEARLIGKCLPISYPFSDALRQKP